MLTAYPTLSHPTWDQLGVLSSASLQSSLNPDWLLVPKRDHLTDFSITEAKNSSPNYSVRVLRYHHQALTPWSLWMTYYLLLCWPKPWTFLQSQSPHPLPCPLLASSPFFLTMSPGKINMGYIRRILSKSEEQVSNFICTLWMIMIKSGAEYHLHRVRELKGKCVARVFLQMPSSHVI